MNYILTRFQKVDKFEYDFGKIQTLGYFNSFDEARKTLLENGKEIFDNNYKYVIIEAVESGYLSEDTAQWLYEYIDGEFQPTHNIVQKFRNFCYH